MGNLVEILFHGEVPWKSSKADLPVSTTVIIKAIKVRNVGHPNIGSSWY